MAKATKTAAKTAAPKSAPKAGSTPAKTAAETAANKAGAGYAAKANAVKAAAEGKSAPDPVKRYVVAAGKSVRSGGVRYLAGEAIDLAKSDGEALKEKGVLVDDDKGATAAETGTDDAPADGQVPLAPGDQAPIGDGSDAGDPQ